MEGFPKQNNNQERESNLEKGFTEEITNVRENGQEISSLIESKKGIISPQAKEKLLKVGKIIAITGIVGGALFTGGTWAKDMIEGVQGGAPLNVDAGSLKVLAEDMGIGIATMVVSFLANNGLSSLSEKIKNRLQNSNISA